MVEIRFKPALVGTVPDGYITEAKLANNAVTNPKLADNAVTKPKVADAAIGNAELEANAVTRDKILDGEVIESKVPPKVFVKADKGTGDKKVVALGYDTLTGEVVLDHEV